MILSNANKRALDYEHHEKSELVICGRVVASIKTDDAVKIY